MPAALFDETEFQQWLMQKLSPQKLEEQLHARGLEPGLISKYLKEYKRRINAKKQFKGFLFASLGAFLGFISCLLTVLNPIPELYNYILFGFTSVAILLIFIGLYFLFE